MSLRVIVVDDEAALRTPVVEYLRLHGLDAHPAAGGAEMDARLAAGGADVVVLDINMPDEDGVSIARRLRADGGPGIIMLTSRADVFDRVVGLEVGADDYMTKPFELRELLARIRALGRRLQPPGKLPTSQTDVSQADPAQADTAPGYRQDFWVLGRAGLLRVDIRAVEWIEASKDYVLLHTETRSHMLRSTMAAIAHDVDPAQLVRTHRSAMVRPGAVALLTAKRRQASVTLHSGRTVPVGPKYLEGLRRRLGLPT